MSRLIYIFGLAGLLVMLAFTGCAGSEKKTTATKKYTCPMHPEVVQDSPGKCPKCDMNLVEKR